MSVTWQAASTYSSTGCYSTAEQDPKLAVKTTTKDGELPLYLLCGGRPPVQVVEHLVRLPEAAVAIRMHAGGGVPFVIVRGYPDTVIYMQEYINNIARCIIW